MAVLLLGIAGLILADWRYRLVFFYRPKAAIKTISFLVCLLLLADITGIRLGIFFTNQRYVTGWHIVSTNLPAEELFFLFLLSYVSLILYRLITLLTKDKNV